MATGFLLFLFIISGSLLFVSQTKDEFYVNLIQQSEANVSKCDQTVPSVISINDLSNNSIKDLTKKSTYTKVFVLSKGSSVQEIRYFYKSKLVAIDILGDNAKIVRRDIFDINGHIRVKLYYLSETPVHKHFLDENGRITFSRPIIMPPVDWRSGY